MKQDPKMCGTKIGFANILTTQMQGCSHGGCSAQIVERGPKTARPSSSTCSPVRFPWPEGRVKPPPVASVLFVSTSQDTTSSQPSVVSTSQGTTSRPSPSTSQGTTSKTLVRTVRGTESNTSVSGGPHHGGGRRARQCRRRRRCRHERTGYDDLEKAPKFKR